MRSRAFNFIIAGFFIFSIVATEPIAASVLLTWDRNSNEDDVVGYNIYRSNQSDGEFIRVNRFLNQESFYQDREADAGSIFYYAVAAVGANGLESELSYPLRVVVPEPSQLSIGLKGLGRFIAGAYASFQVTINNQGRGTASAGNATVTLTLPQGFAFRSVSDSSWTCRPVLAQVECENAIDLAPQSESGFAIDFSIDPGIPSLASISAAVGSDGGASVHDRESMTVWVQYALYFPLFSSDRDSFTSLILSNPSQKRAHVQLTAFGPDGSTLDFDSNPVSLSIDAGSQFSGSDSDLFGTAPDQPRSGWIRVISDNPNLDGCFQFGRVDRPQWDGASAASQLSSRLYFSSVLQGPRAFRGSAASSFIHIANPAEEEAVVALSLVDESGSRFDVQRTIAAGGSLHESVLSLFGKVASGLKGYVEAAVERGKGIVGFERIELGAEGASIAVVPASQGSSRLLSAFGSGPTVFTHFRLINIGDETLEASIRAISDDGSEMAFPAQVTIGPGELIERDAHSLFGFAGKRLLQGTLFVESESAWLVGDVITGDPNRPALAVSLPFQNRFQRQAAFAFAASLPDSFFSGLSIFNPGSDSVQATLEFSDAQGELTWSAAIEVQALQRFSGRLAELLPNSVGRGGFLTIRSQEPLAAQLLMGDAGSTNLAALSPRALQAAVQPGKNPS